MNAGVHRIKRIWQRHTTCWCRPICFICRTLAFIVLLGSFVLFVSFVVQSSSSCIIAVQTCRCWSWLQTSSRTSPPASAWSEDWQAAQSGNATCGWRESWWERTITARSPVIPLHSFISARTARNVSSWRRKDLAHIKAEAKTEELKNSAAKTATSVLNGVNSLLSDNKVSRLEKENAQMQREIEDLNDQIERLHTDMQKLKDNRARELNRANEQHQQEVSNLKRLLDKAYRWFPSLKRFLDMERECLA